MFLLNRVNSCHKLLPEGICLYHISLSDLFVHSGAVNVSVAAAV